jgi:hypothetical protein
MNRLALCAIAATLAFPLAAEETEQRLGETRKIVKTFAFELKKELMGGMKQGGPEAAVRVCNAKAPSIADSLSQRTGWEVGRTSLKVRNQGNAPDDWERTVLESFEKSKRDGTNPATLEHFEVVETDGERYFRYMKAIPTGEVCLVCHGEAIAEPIAEVLAEHYPQDEARGFKVGDIRGAFTIRQPLD